MLWDNHSRFLYPSADIFFLIDIYAPKALYYVALPIVGVHNSAGYRISRNSRLCHSGNSPRET